MKKIFLFLIIPVFTLNGWANYSPGMATPAGGIQFKRQESIKILHESLAISPGSAQKFDKIGRGNIERGSIEVNYLFQNTSDKDITEEAFFPLPSKFCWDKPDVYGFRAWVDGKEVSFKTYCNFSTKGKDITQYLEPMFENCYTPLSIQELAEKVKTLPPDIISTLFGGRSDIEKCLGPQSEKEERDYEYCSLACESSVSFGWQQTFPAGKIVHIRIQYVPGAAIGGVGGAPELELEYILKTANNWQTPIGWFNSIVYGSGTIFCTEEGKPVTYKTAEYKDFIPREDLNIRSHIFPYFLDYWGYCSHKKDEDEYGNVIFVYPGEAKQINCPYKDGCTFYSGADKKPLCRIIEKEGQGIFGNLGTTKGCGEPSQICPIYDKPEHWIKTPYGSGGYFEINSKTEDAEYNYHITYTLKESTAAQIKNLPLCTDYFEKLEGKNKITPKLYKIDGPANIRQLPNGKKIGQMANNTFAWVTAEEGDWCRVIQGDFAGWTHKQNLIDFWNQK